MSADEFQELHEHAEHGAHNPSMAPVSLTMAILAVLVAVVSLLGHRTHTEEVVLQNKVSDQWAYYQAKNIRRHTDEIFADFAAIMTATDAAKETELERRRADRFDLGEVFLEVGLVVTSITLLSGRRLFWRAGMVFGLLGLITASTSLLIR